MEQRLLEHDDTFRYQLLDRLRIDCNYYLGYGNQNPHYLWAGSVEEQINTMKEVWESFPADSKPEWLTWEQILEYERDMCVE